MMATFDEVVAGLGMNLLATMVLDGISTVKAMARSDEDDLLLPARTVYNDVLVPIDAVGRGRSLPEAFLEAVDKTEEFLLRYPDHDFLCVYYHIVMDGLSALQQMLMPSLEV